MKLALIGTHGVGKTTLAFEICSLLKKAGRHVELVTEVARQSPFPVNAETTLEGQLWILHAQIAAELDAARRAPVVIADRSVLDNYCYLVNKFEQAGGAGAVAGVVDEHVHASDWRADQRRWHSAGRISLRRSRVSVADPRSARRIARIAPIRQDGAAGLWLRPGDRVQWAQEIFELAMRPSGD